MLRLSFDGFRQFLRSELSERQVDSRQMLSVERIEFRVVGGTVLRTVPPAPVTSFGGQEGFLRLLQSRFGRSAIPALLSGLHGLTVSLAGVPEQLPRGNIFAVANPHVKIRINPRGWKNSAAPRDIPGSRNSLSRGECTKILVSLDSAVKFAQKFTAISWIVFPGVFAIEKQANRERLPGLHAFANLTKTAVQIGGGVFAAHPAVDEADKIR